MNRRGFLRWGCAHCALLYAAAADAESAVPGTSPDWAPPARFAAPDAASDEGGLWATMAREEQRLRRSPFVIRDDSLRDYLQDIVCRLAGAHCPDVRVYPIRNPSFNANMAPNGMMQIWSGLLLRMDNEAQLAAVLGHEVGHFMQRHSLERLRDAKNKSAANVGMLLLGPIGLVGQLALIASLFAYSREQEREADAISIRLMSSAGYDTSQASEVWANLLAELKARPNADAAASNALFASHPPSDERREMLKSLGKAEGDRAEQAYRDRLSPWQLEFLEDEIKRGQHPETIALLDRKLALAPKEANLLYARAETRRLRAQDKDIDLALEDLRIATALPGAPASAHRSLGLLLRDRKDNAGAAASFTRYLEAAPGAPDAGLIKTYLSEFQT